MNASKEEIKAMLEEQAVTPGELLTRVTRLLELIDSVHPIYTENERFKLYCNKNKLSKLDSEVIKDTKELSNLIDFLRPTFKPSPPPRP